MAKVTVEGSRVTPTTLLAPGQRKTVELTPVTQRRIDRGFFVVVERFDDDAPAPAIEQLQDAIVGVAQAAYQDPVPAAPVSPPAFDADRDTWAAFLDSRTPPIAYDTEDSRDDLITLWQLYVEEQDA